ncbi:thiol-disulfide oxidoreductase [Geobacillus subterraneus]|uniref:Thiol-disulfide oxidoreductase n=2 Tax=Geobacillus TaxID=129337 RepID=A0ABM6A9U6_9BACL|nr:MULTISPECIES: thiol-disulfide oxidoreductase ResA [Geobacillus]AMX83035.1 thiol-disulfide oxidoreductase [Geobacillus subterraneus]KZS27288.1 thiol-disulfide oxidoreductase [Geobacillus subterraneus]OXB91131.1 thiol-disulfide oxidoreductase [Geobacillus uzenensis]QIZ68227.1 thiol-disulfide oxidoreductase ResA [Geobacillus subterraneus]
MKKQQRLVMRTAILLVLLAALGYTIYANFFTEKKAVAVGSTAPDFVLADLKGREHRLSDYRGKGVFLNFWGTWCKPCEREMPYMNELYPVYKKQGVEILAVNVGEPKLSVEKFAERFGLTFPIVIDRQDQVLNAYNVGPLPTTFLIDKNGEVKKIITGAMTKADIQRHLESIKP